jgi:RsiW-degrading membrane proteinase PrsW (M82 family)
LLLAATGAVLAAYAAAAANVTAVPAMLLFGALSGPIAFATFVGDRVDTRDSVSLFELVLVVLFGGAIGVIVGGTLDTVLIGEPNPKSIWWVGFAEETAKLIVPVGVYIFARRRSVAAGLVLGLASATGFAVLETMGYGLREIVKAGEILASETPAQGADRVELIQQFFAGFRVPMMRGLLAPFGHLAWTGIVTTVWWSEWKKRGGIGITGPVVGAYALALFLHSANDFFPFVLMSLQKSDSVASPMGKALLMLASLAGGLIIAIASLAIFWHLVKKRVPMRSHG